MVKKPPASAGDITDMIRCLGREDLLEEGVTAPAQYSFLEKPWTEEPGILQSIGSQRVRHDRYD